MPVEILLSNEEAQLVYKRRDREQMRAGLPIGTTEGFGYSQSLRLLSTILETDSLASDWQVECADLHLENQRIARRLLKGELTTGEPCFERSGSSTSVVPDWLEQRRQKREAKRAYEAWRALQVCDRPKTSEVKASEVKAERPSGLPPRVFPAPQISKDKAARLAALRCHYLDGNDQRCTLLRRVGDAGDYCRPHTNMIVNQIISDCADEKCIER